jgi:hypothetical protein
MTDDEATAVIQLLGGAGTFETASRGGTLYQERATKNNGFSYVEIPDYIPGAVSIQRDITVDVVIARVLNESEAAEVKTLLDESTFRPAIENGTFHEVPYKTKSGSGMWSMINVPVETPPAK